MTAPRRIELLAPARTAGIGIEAINHGADAVYIGGPAFGARAAAGNPITDIARLAAHAHRYSARVYVTLNTILRDDELDAAVTIARQVHEAGVDALIVQDMGLLELDLPPIALHASTQADIRTPGKARFLGNVGFSQLVLARELSLPEIRAIAAGTSATLEFFVHGALCVCYSGRCYLSHARTGRSANRGECAQLCRLPWSLADADGAVVARDRHLLSLKDNDQSANLRALIDAGIGSFKIEGRLKDQAYVKNVTAHYRLLLDGILDRRPGLARASAGRCRFYFTPDPGKTFNRGATDYFVNVRKIDIASFDTPKFAGEPIGRVTRTGRGSFEIESAADLHNGDGLSFLDATGELVGLRVNRAEAVGGAWRLFVIEGTTMPSVGADLFRNLDHEFARLLDGNSAERRIDVRMHFGSTDDGFVLTLTDEEGVEAGARIAHAKNRAEHPERVEAAVREQLGKLGGTPFAAGEIIVDLAAPWYLRVSTLNALRRDAVAALEASRLAAHRPPPRRPALEPPAGYPESALGYPGNVFNGKARAFYARHGVSSIAPAYEADEEDGEVSLMTTKHCLRFSLNLCPRQAAGIVPGPMTLFSDHDRLELRFDCERCEMQVVGRRTRGRR